MKTGPKAAAPLLFPLLQKMPIGTFRKLVLPAVHRSVQLRYPPGVTDSTRMGDSEVRVRAVNYRGNGPFGPNWG